MGPSHAKVISSTDTKIIVDGKSIAINNNYLTGNYEGYYVGGANNRTFNGNICAIRIYNRRLTDDEILYNQRVDNLRFNLGLDLNGGIQPYTPGRELTMSRNLALDEASPLESFDEPQTTEQEECVVATER